jgi:hypothetical protein
LSGRWYHRHLVGASHATAAWPPKSASTTSTGRSWPQPHRRAVARTGRVWRTARLVVGRWPAWAAPPRTLAATPAGQRHESALLDIFWTSVGGIVHVFALAGADGITSPELAPYARILVCHLRLKSWAGSRGSRRASLTREPAQQSWWCRRRSTRARTTSGADPETRSALAHAVGHRRFVRVLLPRERGEQRDRRAHVVVAEDLTWVVDHPRVGAGIFGLADHPHDDLGGAAAGGARSGSAPA